MNSIFLLAIGAAIVNNIVLTQFLGLSSFFDSSKKIRTAAGMGASVIVITTIAAIISGACYLLILKPLHVTYLNTLITVLINIGTVRFVCLFFEKYLLAVYQKLESYLNVLTVNCVVLGVTISSANQSYSLLHSTLYALTASIGFTVTIIVFAGIREKIMEQEIPKSFQGMPINLITAGLMAISFWGFSLLL